MGCFFIHFSGSKQNFTAILLQIISVCITHWLPGCPVNVYILFFLSLKLILFSLQSGSDGRTIPGNTIAVQADMPFTGLTTFGGAFLSKFECSQMPHPVSFSLIPVTCRMHSFRNWNLLCFLKLLEHITFVDTPGVLSGEKQRTQRSYDFTGVTSWFAAKCDLILLLFDPHKLDISDEFKRVISSLRGHDDKIRVVLNKADQVDTQQVQVFPCNRFVWHVMLILYFVC